MAATTAKPSTGRFRGVAPEDRVAHRRALLVEAGLQRFGSDGLHGVGVRQICAEADLSERYFYESFDNLDALVLAVYQHVVARIRQTLVEVVARQDPNEPRNVVRETLRAYLKLLRDDPRLVRIALLDANSYSPELSRLSFNVNRSFADLIVPTMLVAFPDMKARGYDPRRVAEGLLGSTIFLVTQWALDDFRTPLKTMLEHCVLYYDALLSL